MTTTQSPPGSEARRGRKDSRTRRLRRFRTTAEPTRRPTTRPSMGRWRAGTQWHRKMPQRTQRPFRNAVVNAARDRSRIGLRGRQTLATAAAAAFQHGASAGRARPLTKAVRAFATTPFGLKGSFHRFFRTFRAPCSTVPGTLVSMRIFFVALSRCYDSDKIFLANARRFPLHSTCSLKV